MPKKKNSKRMGLPLNILAQQNIVLRIANDLDFDFMQSILRDDSITPEMMVIIQGRCHEENHTATKALNTPLSDMKPSDPRTMMTAKYKSVLQIFYNFYFRSAIIESDDHFFFLDWEECTIMSFGGCVGANG